jgi:hypothetical protein
MHTGILHALPSSNASTLYTLLLSTYNVANAHFFLGGMSDDSSISQHSIVLWAMTNRAFDKANISGVCICCSMFLQLL